MPIHHYRVAEADAGIHNQNFRRNQLQMQNNAAVAAIGTGIMCIYAPAVSTYLPLKAILSLAQIVSCKLVGGAESITTKLMLAKVSQGLPGKMVS